MSDEDKSKLTTKISPLIEGQVPDFIQSDHPIFVTFLKHYYQFLEAGRIKYDSDVQYIRAETNSVDYIILESSESKDGHSHEDKRIITEIGDNGSTGHFVNNETITGSTSGATATVLVEDSRNSQIFITSQQKFITGETFVGATSGSRGIITEYRANPVQNIQQLLDYADVDNNIFDFLTQMKNQFMNAIPESLASEVSKRDLIKSIRDLYAAKGTSEGHKLFLRLLLGENAEVSYPNQFMLRVSNGNWSSRAILRCTTSTGVDGEEALSQLITGKVSGATATVISVGTFVEGDFTVTEFIIDDIVGTFIDNEIITCTSATRNTDVTYIVSSVIFNATVVNDGILHSVNEEVEVEGLGSGLEKVQVGSIAGGSVSEIFVDTAGTGYEVGDDIVFTANSDDEDISTADAFVSVVGGGILSEDNVNNIILEDNTSSSLQSFQIALEEGNQLSDFFRGDGETKVFTLTNLNANTDTITVQIDDVNLETTDLLNQTVWSVSGTTLTFIDAPANGVKIFVRGNDVNYILLDSTDGSADAGHQILTDTLQETQDTYTTDSDLIVLESETFADLSVSTEAGNIRRVFVNDGGDGYTKLPTLTVTSTSGSGTKLLALTNDIGRATGLSVINPGFNHTANNPPHLHFRGHFVLKDVTGTFATNNTLTTHSGTVKSWNADTQVLETTFKNTQEFISESDGTYSQGIELEDAGEMTPAGVILEDVQQFSDGEFITLNGTGTTSPTNVFKRFKITAGSSSADADVIKFFINGIEAPTLELLEGSTYYFDLSDSSLYNLSETLNRQFEFSTTPDGTNAGGVEYTDGITKQATSIRIGTAGAFLKLVVASSSPTLYYYNPNSSGFGNTVLTPKLPDTINDEGDTILLDGTFNYLSNILLESGTPRASATDVLRQESGQAIGTVLGDVNGPEFLLEESIEDAPIQDENSKLVIDSYQEISNSSFLLTEEGGRVSHETFGNSLVLEDNDKILYDDDEPEYYIVSDATDSDGRDENYNIVLEQSIDFSNRDVVITDSSGASGTIINADIGTGTTTIDTWMQSVGSYVDVFSIIDEDLIRIQDSYYYQDYSYEVKVGQSFSTYINELKKAVHPAGFQPFGKVSIASTISVGLRNAGSKVPEYVERFSPILASTFETLFDETLQMRIAAKKLDGQINDTIVLEDGESILFEDRNSGGRLMSEESIAPGGDAEGYALQTVTIKRDTFLPSLRRDNLLLDLAFYPFTENAGIQLENDTPGEFNSGYVVLDGVEVLPQDILFTILEDDSGFVLLEDSGKIIQEGDRWFIPVGEDIADIGEKIHLEEDYEDAGLTFEQVGEIRMSDIFEPAHVRLETVESTYFPDAIEIDEILLESNGQILLDGIDSEGTSAGYKVLQETTKRGYFDLDENGQIEAEKYDTSSTLDLLLQEGINDNVLLEDYFNTNNFDDVRLEDDSGFLLLDGDIVATYSDEQRFRVNLETFETTTVQVSLESTNLIISAGHVPQENYTLSPETTPNKIGLGSLPVIHEAIIDVRTTGDIALEDGTDTTHGYLILDGTDGSSSNQGQNLDLEGATGITI
jgi:hypothetical protein